MWVDQLMVWLTLLISEPEGGQTIKKAMTNITDIFSHD